MKNARLLASAFAVFAIVGSGLAFTAPYGAGSVYSDSWCTMRVDYRVSPNGTITNPCAPGTCYVLINGTNCVPTSGPFVATPPGK